MHIQITLAVIYTYGRHYGRGTKDRIVSMHNCTRCNPVPEGIVTICGLYGIQMPSVLISFDTFKCNNRMVPKPKQHYSFMKSTHIWHKMSRGSLWWFGRTWDIWADFISASNRVIITGIISFFYGKLGFQRYFVDDTCDYCFTFLLYYYVNEVSNNVLWHVTPKKVEVGQTHSL